MKGKIIMLATAFVLGVASIAFSVRPSAVPSGKGGGKNTVVDNPDEIAEILANIPTAQEYYVMAQQAATEKDAKSAAADNVSAKDGFRSLSIYDDFSRSTNSSIYNDFKLGNETLYSTSQHTEEKEYQELTAYYTAEAVYYNVKLSTISCDSRTESYYKDFSPYKKGDSFRTETNVVTNIEAEYYIGVKGAYLKYNKYDVLEESVKYKNGNPVTDEDEDKGESMEELAEQAAFSAVRKNYGKWINAFYFSEYDEDNPPDNLENMDKEAVIDAMVQAICGELSDILIQKLINHVDTDWQSINRIAGVAALAEDKSNEYYNKSGKIYTMTPLGRYTLLSRFGYDPSLDSSSSSSSVIGSIDYEKLTPVKSSSFILDLSEGEKPAWYLDFNYSLSSRANSDFRTSSSTSMHEDFYVTNIDNTVVPNIGSSKTLYDFIGNEIRNLVKKDMGED